ncbi:MAG: replication associated protein [Wigfec virus K19_443]|nr:MAG: replication associated protein [Wigfec virus K19_443]
MNQSTTNKARRYLFTLWLHNQDVVTQENIQSILDGLPRDVIRFLVLQLELCPGTSRRHFQSYIEFTRPQLGTRIARLLAVPSDSLRFEVARGSSSQNIDYCTKEESRISGPWKLGDPSPGQGTRSDLSEACTTLRAHGIKRVAEDQPTVFVKYTKGLYALESILRNSIHTFSPKEVIIRWGSSGTGKTRFAYETYSSDPNGFYRAPAPYKGSYWFDGYQQESTVLFDDYGGDCLYPLPLMLQLLDGYGMLVPIKGGFVPWKPNRIVITSNIDPDLWYLAQNNEQVEALKRRFTDVKRMDPDYQ